MRLVIGLLERLRDAETTINLQLLRKF